MKKRSIKKMLTGILAVGMLLSVSLTQDANALSIRVDSGTIIADGSATDADIFFLGVSVPGYVIGGEASGTFPALDFINTNVGTSHPTIGGADASELHFTVDVTSFGAGSMTVALTDEYDPLAPGFHGLIATAGGSVNANHSVVIDVYLGTSEFDTTGTLIGTFNGGHPITPFGLVVGRDPLLDGTYYITIEETFTFTGAGASSVDVGVVPTPEPASLILMGTGLVGLGLWGRRRSKKA